MNGLGFPLETLVRFYGAAKIVSWPSRMNKAAWEQSRRLIQWCSTLHRSAKDPGLASRDERYASHKPDAAQAAALIEPSNDRVELFLRGVGALAVHPCI